MDKNISHVIMECCKKEGIDYHSINPNYVEFTNVVQDFIQVDRDLRTIEDKLRIIEEKYKIKGLTKIITKAIIKLAKLDHEIIRFAIKIKNERI
jgi:hypothetical protein